MKYFPYILNKYINCIIIIFLLLVSSYKLNAQCTPIIGSNINPLSGCEPLTIQFKENSGLTVSKYSWNFGDGSPILETTNPVHQFNAGVNGDTSYMVSLSITCINGTKSSVSKTVTVYGKPKVSFLNDKDSVCALSDSVCFLNSSQTGVGYSYLWDFGDNTSSALYSPCKIYSSGGDNPVKLTVTNNHGCQRTHSINTDITVNSAPNPVFSLDTLIGCNPLKITYTNNTDTLQIPISSWSWDIGDSLTTFTSKSIEPHIYKNPGIYTISLSARSILGCSNTTSLSIYAKTTPSAAFTATSPICKNDTSTAVYAGGAGVNATYNWNFNNGQVASGSNKGPYSIYWLTGGLKTIELNMEDSGCLAKFSLPVIVNNNPVISLEASSDTICQGENIEFTVLPSGLKTYKFYKNNLLVQSSSSNKYISKSMQNGDKLFASSMDAKACESANTDTIKITVKSKPLITISSSDADNSICKSDAITFTAQPAGFNKYFFHKGNLLLQQTSANNYVSANLNDNDSIFSIAFNNGCYSDTSNGILTKVISKLPVPQINCGNTTINTIQFIWDSIPGASGYELSLNGTVFQTPSSGNLGLSHTINGLNSGDSTSVYIRALGSSACAKSLVSAAKTCKAIFCAPVSFDYTANKNVCYGDPVILNVSNLSPVNYSVQWNNGLFKSDTAFSFSAKQDSTVYVAIKDSTLNSICPATTHRFDIFVNPIPDITLTSMENDSICLGTAVEFNASPVDYDNYSFYDGGRLLQSGKLNKFTTNKLKNNHPIYVIATDKGCSKRSNLITTQVFNPLNQPQVFCGQSTNTSVEFEWDSVPGASSYQVSINGGNWLTPSSGNKGIKQLVNGMSQGDIATLSVFAIGKGLCGNSLVSLTAGCFAAPCSNISYSVAPLVKVCSGSELNLSVSNVNVSSYEVSWNFMPYTSNSKLSFIPAADTLVSVSVKNTSQPTCPEETKYVQVNVIEQPAVKLLSSSVSDSVCEGDVLNFTVLPAGYDNYSFYDNQALVQSGYDNAFILDNIKNKNSYYALVNNQGCIDSSNSIVPTVVAPLLKPQVTLGAITSSTIQFLWDSIPGAAAYEVSVNKGVFVSPSSGVKGLSHTINGLSLGDKVSIVVVALGYGPCANYGDLNGNISGGGNSGNGNSGGNDTTAGIPSDTIIAVTTSANCPAIKFSIDPYKSVCSGQDILLEVKNINIPFYQINWNNTTYDSLKTYRVNVTSDTIINIALKNTNDNACPVVSKFFDIKSKSIPHISLTSSINNDSICDGSSISFTVSPSGYDNYKFYDGFSLAQNNNSHQYTSNNWTDGHTMLVIPANDGCIGDTSNKITTRVLLPLATPQVNCGIITNKSIEFTWDAIVGASGYEISLDGENYALPSTGITGLSHLINNLSANAPIALQVIAKGNLPCGSSISSNIKTCKTLASSDITCSPVSFTINSNQAICKGDSITLNISNISATKYGISWNGTSVENTLSYKLAPTQDTSVIVSVIDSNQNVVCGAVTKQFNIEVKPMPFIGLVSSSNNDSICLGSEISFTAIPSGYDSYEFYRDFLLLQNSANPIYVSNNWKDEQGIRVVAVNKGCVNVANDTIITSVIAPLLQPQVIPGAITSSSIQFLWDSIPGASAYEVSVNKGTYAAPSSGSKGLSHTVSGLNIGDKVSIVVVALGYGPCANYGASNGNISGGGSGNNGNGGGNGGVGGNDTAAGLPSDTLTLATTATNCPALTFDINPYKSVCAGEEVILQVENISVPFYQISWNKGTFSSSKTHTVAVTHDTIINISIKNTIDAACPIVNKFFDIKSKQVPAISLMSSISSDSICEGSKIIFTVSPAGYNNYKFYDGYALKQNTANHQYIADNWSDGHGMFVIPSHDGCMGDTSNIIITQVMSPLVAPQVNCGKLTSKTVEFTWDAITDATAYEVSINGGNFIIPSSGASGFSHQINNLSLNTPIDLQVIAKGNLPCGNSVSSITKSCSTSSSNDITCSPVSFTINSNQSICKGDSISLDVSNISATNYGICWNGSSMGNSISYKFAPTQDTLVIVSVIDSNQNAVCGSVTKQFYIEVKPLPVISLLSSSINDSICLGSEISFTANPSGYDSYEFYRDYLLLQNSANPVYNSNNWKDGEGMRVVASNHGCFNAANDTLVTAVIAPLMKPQVTPGEITSSSVTFLWDSIPGASAYEVSVNKGAYAAPSSGITGLSHTVTGLSLGDKVSVVVVAVGYGPCANFGASNGNISGGGSNGNNGGNGGTGGNDTAAGIPSDTLVVFTTASNCPAITYEINPYQRVCAGEEILLKAEKISIPAYQISWNNGSFSSSKSYNVKVFGDTLIPISIKNTDNTGCPLVSKFFDIKSKSIPTASLISSALYDSICEGSSITFTVSVAGYENYKFYDGYALKQNTNNHQYTTSNWSNGHQLFVIPTQDGCIGDTSNKITTRVLSPISVPQVNCGTTTSKSVEFTWDALPGASSYQVSVNGGNYINPSSGVIGLSHAISGFNANTSITINVIAQGDLPCGNSLPSITKTCSTTSGSNVNCSPVTYFISPEQAICMGDSISLNVSNISASRYSVSWNGFSPDKSLSYKFAPSQDTVVMVTVIDSNQNIACGATVKQFNVEIKPLPVISLVSSAYQDTICKGSLVSFTASPFGYDSYDYYSGYQLMQSGANHIYETNNWVSNKSITLTATHRGCKLSLNDSIITTVMAPLATPQVNAGATTKNSVEFIWDSIPGASAYRVSVNRGSFINPSSGSNGLKHLVSGLSLGDKTSIVVLALGYGPCGVYSESVDGFTGNSGNDSTGSQPSDTITITTTNENCPAITYQIDPFQSVCSGLETTLEISNISIPSAAISWNNGPFGNSGDFKISTLIDTIVYVKVKNTALVNCPTVNKYFDILVKSIPAITLISSAANDSICKGDTIIFTAMPAGYDTYNFYDGYALKQASDNPKYFSNDWVSGHSLFVIPVHQGCIGDTSNVITTKVIDPFKTPEVNCGLTTSNSIEFIWDSVPAATSYMVSINGGNFALSNGGTNAFSHNITGLNPSTSVTLSVYAIGNSLCGKSLVSNLKTCVSTGNGSIICNPVGFEIVSDQYVCQGDSISLVVNEIGSPNYSISWNKSLEGTSNSYKFAPQKDTLVSVSIKNLDQNSTCPAQTKFFNIEVKPLPQTNLTSSINNDSICMGQNISFTANPAGYDLYDFYRGYLLLQSSSNPVYTANNWIDGKSITVVSKHRGCSENISVQHDTIKTTVISPLLTPQVNCLNSTDSSITFTWDSIPNATGYLVSANGGNFITPSTGNKGLTHYLSGLNQSTNHTFQVIALGKTPCGNSQLSNIIICRTTANPNATCTGVTFSINPEQAICKGEMVKLNLSKISTSNYQVNWNGGAAVKDTYFSFLCNADTVITVSVSDKSQPACPETIKRFKIAVKQNPTVVITSSILKDSICQGSKVVFNATPAGYDKYSFYNGNILKQTSDYHQYIISEVTADMQIGVSTQNMGCSDSSLTPKAITMVPKPIISLIDNQINGGICLGDTLVIKASNESFKSYLFYENDKLLQDSIISALVLLNITVPHSIKARAVNAFGCVGNLSNVISNKVHALPILNITSSDNDNKICDKEPVTFIATPLKMLNYGFYSNDSLYQSSASNQFVANNLINEQGFYIIASDSNACISIPSKTIITFVNPIPDPNVQADVEGLCIGNKASLAALLDETNFPGVTYLWSDGQTNKKITVSPNEITSYYLTANYKGCKSAIDTIKLKVDKQIPNANAGEDIVVCPGDSVQLNATGGLSYLWDNVPGLTALEIANPKALPNTTYTYKVNVFNEYCFKYDEVLVTIDRCLKDIPEPIPQVISPNGDGANDFWEIKDVDYFTKNNVAIYNRWGNKVYQASPYDNTWSGKSIKGNDLPDGTYYYVLDLGIGKQPYVGFIMLSR